VSVIMSDIAHHTFQLFKLVGFSVIYCMRLNE